MNSAKYRKSSQPDVVSRWQRQTWAVSGTDGWEEMDVTDGERREKRSLSSCWYTTQEGLWSFFFLLSPLDERRLQQQAGKCNSSGQTLIFSLSFPPTQHFVDIVVLILSFLEWMEESEAWKRSKEARRERHRNDKAHPLKAEPNALLKG